MRSSTSSDTLHDVELRLTEDKIIHIHSSVLRQCSGFFSSSLSWPEASQVTELSLPIVYELELEDDIDGDIFRKQGTTGNLELSTTSTHERDESYYKAYLNLFDIFQHRTPSISNLDDIMMLIKLADKYDGLPAVSRAIRMYLMESNRYPLCIYQYIAADPVKYLYVGEKTRSVIITKEASTHVLGTWSRTRDECQSLVSNTLFESLTQRHKELVERKNAANKKLLSLNLTPPVVLDVDNLTDAAIALIRVREGISLAFSRCYQEKDPENFEGKMYREIAQSTNIDNGHMLRVTPGQISRPTDFEATCISLRVAIHLALGSLNQLCLRSMPLIANTYPITSAQLEDSDMTWDCDWK